MLASKLARGEIIVCIYIQWRRTPENLGVAKARTNKKFTTQFKVICSYKLSNRYQKIPYLIVILIIIHLQPNVI